MGSLNQTAQPSDATRVLAGIIVPDTPIVARAIDYAREHCEPYLFNHQMRSWLFAAAIAQVKGSPHDPEVLAVATLLHESAWRKHSAARCASKWKGPTPHGRSRARRACWKSVRNSSGTALR